GSAYIGKSLSADATPRGAPLMKYADSRSGSSAPLAEAPDDKQIVLGLVTTKSSQVQTASEIAGRVDDAAKSFPREQLGVSTQCGFASIAAGNPITEEDEERKLRLVAEVAETVWG